MSDFNVRFLTNSGFLLEYGEYLFIFDDECQRDDLYGKSDFSGKKAVFFCVSHSHYDHFNARIFTHVNHEAVHYVLSYDILAEHEKITHLAPGDEAEIEGVRFAATASTDMGISLTVQIGNVRIFHAGDLNDWHWKDAASPVQSAFAHHSFLRILDTVSAPIDIAFFPVDPRLGTDYAQGADLFLQRFSPRYMIPMHFREETYAAEEFRARHAESSTVIVPLTHPGDSYRGTLCAEREFPEK